MNNNLKDAETLFHDNYRLAENTLYRLLQSPHSVALSKSIEYNDLLQYANLGLWNAAITYSDEFKFQTHAINHIRWAVLDALNVDCDQFSHNRNLVDREDYFNVTSFEQEVSDESESDGLTLHDIIASEESELDFKHMLNKDYLNKFIKELSDRQKDILLMKEDGYTYQDIADKYGLYRQSVQRTHKNLIEQILERVS